MATGAMECQADDKEAYEQDREEDRGAREGWVIMYVLQATTFPTRITRKVPKCHERAVKSPVKKGNRQAFLLLYWKTET